MPNHGWMEELDAVAKNIDPNDLDPASGHLPESEHVATIVEASLNEEKRSVQLKLHFDAFNATRTKWMSLSPKGVPYLLRDMKTLGIEIDTFKNLPSLLPGLVGLRVEVAVRNRRDNPQYQNFFINKALGRDRLVTEVAETFGPVTIKDDIPF